MGGGQIVSNKPLVTVMIPVFNREKYLAEAIESVVQQTYPHWKLLVIDDASTDRTGEIAKSYLSDTRIAYERLSENVGPGRALSAGIQKIDTPYCVILDSDDWFDPKALEILTNEMNKQPLSTNLVFSNGVVWQETSNGTHVAWIEKHKSFDDKYEFMKYKPMLYPRFFRTNAIRRVISSEWDDPSRGRYMEDRYMLFKLIGRGNFHWVDQTLYHRRFHTNNTYRMENWEKFAEVRLHVYRKMLLEWGNEYEPIWARTNQGWLYLKELVKKQDPKVTVVIPTYNRANFIQKAIESIFLQTMQNWNLLIIDDASTDNSFSIIQPYLQDPRVRYVRRPTNQGICHVMNDVLPLVNTKYSVQLDADDWLEPETLETLTNLMDESPPETAMAYANKILHYEKEGNRTEYEKHRLLEDKYDVLLYRWMVFPRFYRTEAVREVGGWDTDIPYNGRYIEDRQILYKLADRFPFAWTDRYLYNFRIHGTNQTFANVEKYAELRIYFVQKFFSEWNKTEHTGKVVYWEFNKAGWPQFKLIPENERQSYSGLCFSSCSNEPTEGMFRKASIIFSKDNRIDVHKILFCSDSINLTGRYVKGYKWSPKENGSNWEKSIFPLPNHFEVKGQVDSVFITKLKQAGYHKKGHRFSAGKKMSG